MPHKYGICNRVERNYAHLFSGKPKWVEIHITNYGKIIVQLHNKHDMNKIHFNNE